MYFPLFELHGCGKRSGIPPKTIYSEVPSLPRQSRPPRTPPGALLVQIVLDGRLFGAGIGKTTMLDGERLYQYGAQKVPLLCKVDKHKNLSSIRMKDFH